MTITIVAPWGVWQCSDHRLTNPHTGKLEQDDSVKHVCFRFPDGGALLAYAGIGRIYDVQISDWIREVLRGESRSLDDSLSFLRDQATKSIGPHMDGRIRHMFTLGVFLSGVPWIVQIRNFEVNQSGEMGPPEALFRTAAHRLEGDPMVIVFGTPGALTSEDQSELLEISRNRPKHMDDFHGLLARYNRRAAFRRKRHISKACATSFMPPEAEPISSKQHSPEGERAVDITVPVLLFGMDFTDVMKQLKNTLHELRENEGSLPTSEDSELDKASRSILHQMDRLLGETDEDSGEA
jgi:hypothetical protein